MTDPVSWLQIEQGWSVVASDGAAVGTVAQVEGDKQSDIFDGLAVESALLPDGIRYVPGEQVGAIHPGEVSLKLDSAEAGKLEPFEAPPPETTWLRRKPPLSARISGWLHGKREARERRREGLQNPPVAGAIEIRRLASVELSEQLDALARVLEDCVAGGASVSYMAPFSHEDARAVFEAWAAEVEQGGRLILAAFADGDLVGTVQVILALPPNQPHRGEIAKLLVHRSARRRGIAELLMERAEAEARAEGKTLLVLDAVTGGDAARLYDRMGWITVGVIPGYALYPDGRPCDTTIFFKSL